MCNSSYILNWNFSKLRIFAYYHIKNCLSLQQFDTTIFKEFLPFLTEYFIKKFEMRNSFYLLNGDFSKFSLLVFEAV